MEAKVLNELKNAKSVDDLIKIAKDSGLHLDAGSAEKIFKEIKKGGNVDIGGILKSVLGGSKGSTSKTAGQNAVSAGTKSGSGTEKAVSDAIGSILKGVTGGKGETKGTAGTKSDCTPKTGSETKKNNGTEKAVEDAIGSVLKKVIK